MRRRRGRAGVLRERIDVIAIVLTGVGVLFGVWRMVDGARRELGARIEPPRPSSAASSGAELTP